MKKSKIWSGSHRQFKNLKLASWLSIVGAIGVLAAVMIAQYILGYAPCKICIWQRWPWLAVAIMGGVSLLLLRFNFLRLSKFLMGLIILSLLVGAGIALYHVGIEYHWWAGPVTCSGGGAAAAATDLESLRRALTAAPVVFCDQPAWQFYGLTMAGLNLLLSLALVLLIVLSLMVV
ncbi:MAG: disulfide bond formation protein B [Candidatus Pacebacteria bacterium]|nr:disulfide bond formation protein B [Candidatus Paceibacterota bacterium]